MLTQSKSVKPTNKIINPFQKFGNDIRRVLPNGSPVIAVVVISCNRVTIQQCLDELLKWRPSMEQFPIIVSEDCSHQPTINVIRSYGDQVTLIQVSVKPSSSPYFLSFHNKL